MRFERLGTFCFSGFASLIIFSAAQAANLEISQQPSGGESFEEETSLEAILDAEIFENQRMEESVELLNSEKIEEEFATEIANEIDAANDTGAANESTDESQTTNLIPPSESIENSLETQTQPKENVQLALSSPIFKSIEGEAPLAAPVRWAKEVIREMESNVVDYSCTLSKRERVNGILGKKESISVKLRHEPFSVYLKFEKPRKLTGREVIYVENENDGKLLAHGVGLEAMVGTMQIEPGSRLAMKGNRYPITNLGMLNLVKLLVALAEKNLHESSISVRYFDALIDGKECVCVEVVNSNPQINFQFHRIQVFVDMELNLPVKFVSWGWGNNGEKPLMEEYAYSNIKLNKGFTDQDFDVRNPEYEFRESKK